LNISNGKVDLSDVKFISEQKSKELIRSEVHPGDIVVVAVGSSGLACLIPESLPRAIMSQNFNKITPDAKKINPVFLEYCINSDFVQRQLNQEITDTVRTFLSLTKLISVKIPVPPLNLQEEFAGVVARVESLRGRMSEGERQVEGLFESLLAEAFS
jgi:type I restriction enzyme S subunit